MRILLDSASLQVIAHREHPEVQGTRLKTFVSLLTALTEDAVVDFSEGALTRKALANCALLVVATRIQEFAAAELDAAQDYVREGGGLLLMSNHAAFYPGAPDFTREDSALAGRFGIRFEGTGFADPNGLTRISGEFLEDHPIITGQSGEPAVVNLVTNTTCSIGGRDAGRVIAYLPDSMKDHVLGHSPRGKVFALSLDYARGRVVAIADSGFIGSRGTNWPGAGLIEEGDNILFVQRTVRWLTRGGSS